MLRIGVATRLDDARPAFKKSVVRLILTNNQHRGVPVAVPAAPVMVDDGVTRQGVAQRLFGYLAMQVHLSPTAPPN